MSMIGGAPLAKTSAITTSAGPKGLVAVEGAIVPGEQPLIAPCSGRACLYYEVVTHQRWQKYVQSNNGSTKVSGKKQIKKDAVGARFYIDDGSGPAKIDASECKVNSKMEKTFEQEGQKNGFLTFGSYEVNVPPYSGDGWGTGTVCIEKIIPAEGNAYVAGTLSGDTIIKKQNVGGRLLIAREGLDALQGSTKMKMLAGLIGGAFLFLSGSVMGVVGLVMGPSEPAPSEVVSIAPGFAPTPMTVTGLSGGTREASTLSPNCNGNISVSPDLEFTVSAPIPMLRVMAKSTVDTTLIVEMPNGTYLCNDDFEDLHPAIDSAFAPGQYKVWVGSYSSGEAASFSLGLTENVTLQPSSL